MSFKDGNPDKPCCAGCPVYKFDWQTEVDAADWTVDAGTVTFNQFTVDLGPGAKVSLNAVTLDVNNYAATLDVQSSHTAADLQLFLGDASARIDHDSGAFTLTISDGTTDTVDSGTDAEMFNPALQLCLEQTAMNGSSGWTYQAGLEGYGHTKATYSGTLSGSLSIENHSAETVRISGVNLTRWVLSGGAACQNCYPEVDCSACSNGWVPTSLAYTISNRKHGIPPCHATLADAQASTGDCAPLSGADYTDTITDQNVNPCTLGKIIAEVLLFRDNTSIGITEVAPGCWRHQCSTPSKYSRLLNVYADYNATNIFVRIILSEHDDDGVNPAETRYTLHYDIDPDDCFTNLSLTLNDFYVQVTNVISGSEIALSPETLAIGFDGEPSL